MFTCERCGVNSADGFIMLDGTWLCTRCAMPTDTVDQNSLSAVAQAKTAQGKIEAWRNCNGIQASPKSDNSGDRTMAEKTKLLADFISAENVRPNERSEFALGLAVAPHWLIASSRPLIYFVVEAFYSGHKQNAAHRLSPVPYLKSPA